MNQEVHAALRTALCPAFKLLLPLLAQAPEPHVRIERRESGWMSGTGNRPSFLAIVMAGQEELARCGSPCIEAMRRHHPEYLGLIGSDAIGRRLLFQDPANLLRSLVYRHAFRHGTSAVNDEQIDALIHELEAFIDDPCVCLKCVVELQNFSMEAESISLANALSIRRLSDDEVSELHGGPYWSAARPSVSLHEISGFAVVAQITEPKRFGDSSMVQSSEFAKLTTSLDQVLLALRTFKSGQTGLSVIQIIPPDFLGFRSSLSRIGDLPVPPFGAGFQLSASEVEHFREHAARLFSPLDPAIELACSRLSDAEARNRYQDRLLDAVIGLEAVLLVSVGTDDRRGELTNRFALNFSTLHDGAKERFRQYLIARDMFGHRSTIAHGGDIKGDNLKLGDEKVTLIDAANRACGMLRFVIRRFLPEGASPTFRRERWWERKLFGLESEAR